MDHRANASGRHWPWLAEKIGRPLLGVAVLFVAACSPGAGADSRGEDTAATAAAVVEPGLTAEPPDTAELPPNAQVVALNDGTFMVPYEAEIPGFGVTYRMTPIPGGTFTMGSPPDEPGREEDEGPHFEVEVEPFWMGTYPVTWAEYEQYMGLYDLLASAEPELDRHVPDGEIADAASIPTQIYIPDVHYGAGVHPRHPAVTMTQYAARQYTKFLSKLTSRFYRLPTEAEWEYAARAGTTTAWSFGDDGDQLDDHAWYYGTAGDQAHLVGSTPPNPWGLYHMHGNVANLVIDQYVEDHYQQFADAEQPVHGTDAIAWPTEPWPIVVRGGSWDHDAEQTRSASRWKTNDPQWKMYDPDLPRSVYWFSEFQGQATGFRIVRPLIEPDEDTQNRFWGSGEHDLPDQLWEELRERLERGKALFRMIDTNFPAAEREWLEDWRHRWQQQRQRREEAWRREQEEKERESAS